MSSAPIREAFLAAGVSVTSPDEADRRAVIELIERLQHGDNRGAAAEIQRLADGRPTILGCTELALAFPDAIEQPVIRGEDTVYFNSLAIHAEAILDRAAIEIPSP